MINLNQKVDEVVLLLKQNELHMFGYVDYYTSNFTLNTDEILCPFQKELVCSFFNNQYKLSSNMTNVTIDHMNYTIKKLKEVILQHYFDIND